jgi:pyridoxamine 5'-phosphate oxidase
MKDLENVRKDYTAKVLMEHEVAENPCHQLQAWLDEAQKSDPDDFNTMTLATMSDGGVPSPRIVLLRGLDEHGLTFFTNYESDKGKDLAKHPLVGVNFFWKELQRQVRVHGEVEKLSAKESDAYFASRPRESQLGAWASDQSSPIEDRGQLEAKVAEIQKRFEGKEVPRPEFWGGYLIKPFYYEFWQGRASRLHDRLAYRITADATWYVQRLCP